MDSVCTKIVNKTVSETDKGTDYLAGKVVVITGGSGSLGTAFAKKLLEQHAKVCLCDLDESKGHDVSSELEKYYGRNTIMFATCDVTKDDSFKEALQKCKDTFGKIDILINNAGVFNEQDFQKTIEVNLTGTMRGTFLVLEDMRKDSGNLGGTVVNIASNGGLKPSRAGISYSGSKAGVIHFSRSMGAPFHFSYTGVRILCVCPSMVDNDFLATAMKTPFSSQVEDFYKENSIVANIVSPEDVANVVLHLLREGETGDVVSMVPGGGGEYFKVEPSIKE